MKGVVSTTRLQLNKREITFLVPLYITAGVVLITALIALILWRAGAEPGTPEWVDGSRQNGGMVWGMFWFIGYLGVQAVATTFPFAMTLGATRRDFTLGTFGWTALIAGYLTVIYTVLCLLERVTDHWFVGLHIVDVHLLGSGDLRVLVPATFLGAWSALSIGGLFAAAWVRYRNRGPQLLATGLVVVLLVALVLVVPVAGQVAEAFRPWWLAVAAAVVITGSGVGTWTMLRTASVR